MNKIIFNNLNKSMGQNAKKVSYAGLEPAISRFVV